MATTPEGRVKIKLDNWLNANMPDHFRFKVPGGPFGRIGMPDYFIVYLGVPIMIEVKADETCDATPRQKLELSKFAKAGGIACILRGFQVGKLEYIKKQCEERNAMGAGR